MTPNGAALRQLIQQKAATPQGFSIADGEAAGLTNGPKVTSMMVAKGQLFKARVQTMTLIIRYFTTAEAKREFEARYEGAIMASKTRPVRVVATPKPHRTAQIVYPEGYKFTRCPTPAPRFQAINLPFQHGQMKEMV